MRNDLLGARLLERAADAGRRMLWEQAAEIVRLLTSAVAWRRGFNPALTFGAAWVTATALGGALFPTAKPEWSVDFGGGVVGHPVHFGRVEETRGILVTEHPGRITLVSPRGEKRLTMALDLPVETPAVAVELQGKARLSVVAVDAWGSVYCFNERGERQWKFPRTEKSGEFRLPVFADLNGDGRLEVIVPDSRGHLDVLDALGRLRLELTATKYRVGVPAVGDINGDGKSELIFGTEAGEVYCVNGRGDVLWSTTLDGSFGRAFPLIADADQDGNYEVYFPTAFNNAHPGLFALDAATGRLRWKAPSVMQSYRSTVVADLDGDGRTEILFGDKNSSLFCLDAHGQPRWTTQLAGRGIFFAPAVADLQGDGAATSFAVVRAAGTTGKSFYALDAAGRVWDELALRGGGGCSPILCRFQGRADVSLLVLSAGGQLLCYRPEQKDSSARILWPGVRNDLLNSGFIKSAHPTARKRLPTGKSPQAATIENGAWGTSSTESHSAGIGQNLRHKNRVLGGTNRLPLPPNPPDADLVSLNTVCPDASVRLDLIRLLPGAKQVTATFTAATPGDYQVTVRWHEGRRNTIARAERWVFRLDSDFRADAARVAEAVNELQALGQQAPALGDLTRYFSETTTAALARARRTKAVADFDALHWKCDYSLGLARHCRARGVSGRFLLHQLANPWENFDPAAFFGQGPGLRNSLLVHMLGNEYESAALALANLRPRPATFRLACGAFQAGAEQVEAKHVLEFREVLSVRPDGTGELTEDPLPLLGEGQTVRLDAGETRKLWLTFRSQSLLPGTWRAMLSLGDLGATEPPVDIPVTVEVDPVRLPDRFTYRECNWLYLDGIRDETLREATLRDALEHGMNVFVIPGVSIQVDEHGRLGQSDTAAHDQLVNKLRGCAFFLVSGPVSVRWPASAQPEGELREQTFAEALRWYARHVRSLGCDYDDYAIYLQDEPGLLGHDAGFEAFVAQVKRFKAADPRMQLYANPAGGARADLLRPLQNLIDVWAPDLHLVREQPGELKQVFQHARHYWHYEAPGDQRYLDPLGFYRMKPWVAFQMGMTGGGYWVYSSADFWSAEPGGGSEYGTVYPTNRGPVTTKRWEASRDGIEDFELLWLLRKTAEQSAAPRRQQALALIDEAVRFVTRGQENVTDVSRHVRPYTPDYQQWMRFRRELVQMQRQLTP